MAIRPLRRIIRFGAALAALLAAGCSAPTEAQRAEPRVSKIVGAWRSKVQFQDGPFASTKDLEFLYSFNHGGTMTESSNYDGAPPVPPAYGSWREIGASQFEAKYIYYNSKAPAKFEDIAGGAGWLPNGRGELTERITVSEDGKSFESKIDLVMYDQAGKATEGGGSASGRGTRIGF